MPLVRPKSQYVVMAAGLSLFAVLLLPSLSWASGDSAKFFVSAWLVRIWLGLVGGTALVAGVMLALDSYSSDYTLEPVKTADARVTMEKRFRLSYAKIGSGLLCVILGGLFFVTVVFLLPDKRTGYSGVGKIIERFTGEQAAGIEAAHGGMDESDQPSPATGTEH